MLDVINLILVALLIVVLVWLLLTIKHSSRRFLHGFEAMANTLDDMKRALQALNNHVHSAGDCVEDNLRRTNDALASTERVLRDIREAIEAMLRR
jgi:Flp pilus assembly protein TadB